jgi:hypothetical protein
VKIKAQIPTTGSKLTRFIGRALGLVSSVVAGKAARERAVKAAREKLDRMSNPPEDWLPHLRKQVRLNLWYRATVKAWLKATDLPKAEKQFLRRKFFHGHWDRPQLTPDGAIKASGAAARKRLQKARRIARCPKVGSVMTLEALLA